jgi:hypothetical protein
VEFDAAAFFRLWHLADVQDMAGAISFPMEERTWAGAGMQFSAGHWPTYSVTSHLRFFDVAAKLKCQH